MLSIISCMPPWPDAMPSNIRFIAASSAESDFVLPSAFASPAARSTSFCPESARTVSAMLACICACDSGSGGGISLNIWVICSLNARICFSN